MQEAGSPAANETAPPGGHRLTAAGAAVAVALGGGALLGGPAILDRWGLLEDPGSPAGSAAAPPEAESQPVQVRLAFLGADGRTLEEEPRELTLKRSTPAAARAILEALRAGSRQGRGAVLPPAVQVRHVFVDKRGVAYVDLSPEILRPSAPAEAHGLGGGAGTADKKASALKPSAGAVDAGPKAKPPAAPEGVVAGEGKPVEADAQHSLMVAAQAIAATLGMSLPEIAQVQTLVEGREAPVVTDAVDLRQPLPASLPIRSSATPR